METKAPILHQQRAEYERAIASHTELTRRLGEAMAEIEEGRETVARLTANMKDALDENALLKQENVDLSRQVQNLLREIAESSGVTVTDTAADGATDVADMETASAGGIINARLITFSSIADLQRRNQELIEVPVVCKVRLPFTSHQWSVCVCVCASVTMFPTSNEEVGLLLLLYILYQFTFAHHHRSRGAWRRIASGRKRRRRRAWTPS